MGGLFVILPIVAFDLWLALTTGRRQFQQWAARGQRRPVIYVVCAGMVLAFLVTFVLRYNWNKDERVQGLPIPLVFFHLDDKTWTRTTLPGVMPYIGGAADILTGLVAPMIPFKIAEFLKVVKAELK